MATYFVALAVALNGGFSRAVRTQAEYLAPRDEGVASLHQGTGFSVFGPSMPLPWLALQGCGWVAVVVVSGKYSYRLDCLRIIRGSSFDELF